MSKKHSSSIQDVRPRSLLLGHHREVAGINKTIDDIRLRGKEWRARVTQAVTDASLSRTLEGASTVAITCNDRAHKLRKSKLLEERFDVELDGLGFRIANIAQQSGALTLTFEDRDVARLRKMTGAKKALRSEFTRAEFVLMLIREVKDPPIPAWIPELHVEQPIEAPQDKPGTTTKVTGGGPTAGVSDPTGSNVKEGQGQKGLKNVHLTVKHVTATADQIQIGSTILSVGSKMGASWQALAASIMAAIQESNMTNLSGGDASSVGVFQIQVPGTAPLSVASSVEKSAQWWFGPGGGVKYGKTSMSLTEIAQAVERSAYPSAYAAWQDEGIAWVKAFNGGELPAGASISSTTTTVVPYSFERRPNEDSWTCITRLAEEVQWRAFFSNGIFYYVSEPELRTARIEMRVQAGFPGVDDISWEWDEGKDVQELTVTGRARAWAAPPGTVAHVTGEGKAADGRYITSTIDSNLFTPDVSVSLKRPTEPLPEPAPETKTSTSTSTLPGSGGSIGDIKNLDTSCGSPHWGGGADITEALLYPIAHKMGVSVGAHKETGHAVGGDHDPTVLCAYATDFGTTSGEGFAEACAKALGINGYHTGSFDHWSFNVSGQFYQCQILWSVPDHYDHVHVGIRKGGY